MSDTLTTTIDALAVYRLTRLAVEDTIFDEPRDAILDRLIHAESFVARKASEGLTCPWCMSMYVAAAAFVFRAVAPKTWRRLSWVLAASAVAGLLSGHEYDPDEMVVKTPAQDGSGG